MKNKRYFIFTLFAVLSNLMIVWSQGLALKQTNESGIYKNRQTAKITLIVNDKLIDSVTIKVRKNYSKQVTEKKVKITGDSLVVFNDKLTDISSIMFEVSSGKEFASIGLIVDPHKFKPTLEHPKDIKSFWNNEKLALRALPMVVDSVLIKNKTKGYQCYNVEINCLGSKPARGYFAKPDSAKAKSLPIVLNFHAAGVSGNWCRSEPDIALRFAKMGKGALCFDLNAHGMLNGQTDEYYINLEKGELKDYNRIGLDSKSDIYFRSMYLRLLRTLDFLTSQPEWDGKRILVVGESQGGGQALAAAGLDNRVKAVVATVPAMCAWDTCLTCRKGGWPHLFEATNYKKEKLLSTLPYFDVAHILKESKATIVTEIGLIDVTCPAFSIYSAINPLKGKKVVYTVPYRAHNLNQPVYNKLWENTVHQPKDAFIANYLK